MTGTLFWASYAALWVITLALAISTVLAYRFMAEAFVRGPRGRREQGPEVGRMVKSIVTRSLNGGEVRLGPGQPERSRLILFLAAGCKPCSALLPFVREFAAIHASRIETVAMCDGKEEAVVLMADSLGPHVSVIRDAGGEWRSQFQVLSVPFFVAVSGAGVVRAKGKARTLADVEGLADQLTATRSNDHHRARERPLGTESPNS
jgi:hypothetical protein